MVWDVHPNTKTPSLSRMAFGNVEQRTNLRVKKLFPHYTQNAKDTSAEQEKSGWFWYGGDRMSVV